MIFVYGRDAEVADWAFKAWGCNSFLLNMAVGVSDGNKLVGAFAFSGYNGSDIEAHFYGPGALKRQVVREITRVALMVFEVNRMSVRTRKPSVARGHRKLGAIYEGKQKCFYGPSMGDEHAAECYVFFRPQLERLAR